MKGDYTKSYNWKIIKSKPLHYPLFPPSRVIKVGTIGDCPNCGSTTDYYGKLFGSKETRLNIITKCLAKDIKKYCINGDCLYFYFNIEKDSIKIDTVNTALNFVKSKEREYKLNKIGV